MRRTPLRRSTYRALRSDEDDPPGRPMEYTTTDGVRRLRWKVAPGEYVERYVRDEAGQLVRARPMVAKRIDRDEARRRYEAGESTLTIAKALGCHASQVSRALRQMGVVMRRGSASPIDVDEMVRRYMAGDGYSSIAKSAGVSTDRVRRALVAAGVRLRPVGRVRGRGRDGGRVSYETEFEHAKPLVRQRSRGVCEAGASANCTGIATHVHHRKMRSQGGSNDLVNLMDVCLSCHSTIHKRPSASYDAGWLIRSWKPEAELGLVRRA